MEANVIQLPQPDREGGERLMNVLNHRHTERNWTEEDIDLQTLSTLLWAGVGVNREKTGGLTAPSTMNYREIDLYVCLKDGAYFYDNRQHALIKKSDKDLRMNVLGRQQYKTVPPVGILLVCDESRIKYPGIEFMGLFDTGIVLENLCLACTSLGLVNVPRGVMDKEVLSAELGLSERQKIHLNTLVGHPLAAPDRA